MKKLSLFLAILFVSVLCTACINNIAVQELNNKAQEYMQKGDVKSAICRLESSVDLDGSIFETRYNLAVAYIEAQEFQKAQKELEEALKINPEYADAYFSLAIAQENNALKVLEEDEDEQEDIEIVVQDSEQEEVENISKEDVTYLVKTLDEAIKSYRKYLELKPQCEDKEQVLNQISSLEDTMTKYAQKYEIEIESSSKE